MFRLALPVLLVAILLAAPALSQAQQTAAEQNTGGQPMETTHPSAVSAAPAASAALGSSNALKPIVVDPGAPAPPVEPPVAYEAATLPKDTAQAWGMLVAATGLHGVTAPFHVKALYKTYDAEGKAGRDGVYEYTWLDRNHWSARWTEGGSPIWQRWKTEKGIFAPPGQNDSNQYPESLVAEEILTPLHDISVPLYLGDENFPSMTLSCFRDHPYVAVSGTTPPSSFRYCTAKGRPILRLIDSDYIIYFNKTALFQHRIVAQMINVRENDRPVVDIDIEEVRTPTKQEEGDIQPPTSAVLGTDASLLLSSDETRGRLIKKQEPSYPTAMKQARVRGNVRLSVEIDPQGKVHILDVLSSPDPALTRSAEEAVGKWEYSPFLKDGKPVSVRTMIRVTYALGH